jgi:protein TonB
MVLVDSNRSFARIPQVRPDVRRIAAYAGAIALNFALLLLVSLPMQEAPPLPVRQDGPVITVHDIPKEKPVPPVVPIAPRIPLRPNVPVVPVRTQAPTPPVEVPILVDNGSEAYVPPVVPPVDATTQVTGPVTGMSLEYASAPAPSYPRDALREGITGTVLLEVLVDVDGSPLKVSIHHSSGNRDLDRAAQQQVQKHWRFRPASRNGTPVQAIGIVPIDFKLN